MILYLFVTLIEKRNRLIDKLDTCGGTSGEIFFKLRQVDMEIVRNRETFFGQLSHDQLDAKGKGVQPSFSRFIPKKIQYAVQ